MSGVWGPQNAACPCFLPLPGSSRLLTPTAKGQCDVSAWLLTSPAPRHVGDRFLWGAPAPSAPLTRWLLSCCPHPSPSRSQLSVHSVGRQVWLRGRGGGGAPQNCPGAAPPSCWSSVHFQVPAQSSRSAGLGCLGRAKAGSAGSGGSMLDSTLGFRTWSLVIWGSQCWRARTLASTCGCGPWGLGRVGAGTSSSSLSCAHFPPAPHSTLGA